MCLQWQKPIDLCKEGWSKAIEQTFDFGYISAATRSEREGNTNLSDFCIFKLDSSGGLLWVKIMDDNDISDKFANSIHQTYDKGYIAAGNRILRGLDSAGNKHRSDFYIVKLTLRRPLGLEINDMGNV